MGRGKVELKRISSSANRQVTFSKRCNGILKKALELSVLCESEVAVLVSSSSGHGSYFASHNLDRTIARYKNEAGLPQATTANLLLNNTEFWRCEIEEMKASIESLETSHKQFSGEDIGMLGFGELQQLERKLKVGVERVRCNKKRILSEHISTLKQKHRTLQEENAHLQTKLSEYTYQDASRSVNTSQSFRRGN